MSGPRLLDLFCCAGGAGMGYARAGFEVVGIDVNPQPNYAFAFIQTDALEYVRDFGRGFDAVHASPPCQANLHGRSWQTEKKYWTSYRKGNNARRSAVVQVYGSGGETHRWGPALGIDWMSPQELTQAIPPAYTEHIGKQLLNHLRMAA